MADYHSQYFRDAEAVRAKSAEIVERLLRQPESTSGIWHPLGFIVLKPHGNHEQLRLHIWPSGERHHANPCWPIHDHVWDMQSFVLCGSLTNHVVAPIFDLEGSHQIYRVRYFDACTSALEAEGAAVSLRELDEKVIHASEFYSVPRDVFHRTTVDAQTLTATLVTTSNSRGQPRVVGSASAPDRVEFERELCDDQYVRERLDQVLGLIARTR